MRWIAAVALAACTAPNDDEVDPAGMCGWDTPPIAHPYSVTEKGIIRGWFAEVDGRQVSWAIWPNGNPQRVFDGRAQVDCWPDRTPAIACLYGEYLDGCDCQYEDGTPGECRVVHEAYEDRFAELWLPAGL